MAGEIMAAYITVLPSMKNFGTEAARQIGPQARSLGTRAGQQAGSAFTSAASKESGNWFTSTAQGAIKNVALYGSMYAAIQTAQRGIDAVFDSMIGFNSQIEQATVGFETLLGSSAAASEQMQWIKTFARETPFQYKDLVGYSQQLLALGFNAEMSRDVLQSTGDAAAALGRGSQSIERINLALGQMWTKGKVQSQEMLQLTEAGIGGWQILAEAYGTSVENVQEAVTAGLVKASDAVPALLDGMNARFGGLMEKQSQTYAGTLSNIKDTLQQQLAASGKPLFDELTIEAKKFLEALKDPEVTATLDQVGTLLAEGAQLLAGGAEFALKYRDAILAAAVGYGVLRLAQQSAFAQLGTSGRAGLADGLLGGSVGTWREASTAVRTARTELDGATKAAAAATKAHADAGLTFARANTAVAVGNTEVKRSIYNYNDWTTATTKLRAAELQQFEASQALTMSAPARIAAETATQRALGATMAAEIELKAARLAAVEASKAAGIGMLKTIGPVVGIMAMADGYSRVGKSANDAGGAALGFAEATAGGAIAGAALGSIIPVIGTAAGAAIGALGGLTTSVWSYQKAIGAANHDTSLTQEALQALGVDASLATLALGGVTNAQLDAAGGTAALLKAMKSGTTSEFIAGLEKQAEFLRANAKAADEAAKAYTSGPNGSDPGGYAALGDAAMEAKAKSEQLDRTIQSLRDNSGTLAAATNQVVTSNYQAAFAADMQTGSLGALSRAAWDAVVAQGGLGAESLVAAARMEGLAGVAGYATQMISGIPTGTAINFSTNAAEITAKIASLVALQQTVNNMAGGATMQSSIEDQIRRAKQQLAAALTTPVTTLTLPTGGSKSKSGGAAKAVADAAAQAAQEAARKLEQDRNAQVRFGDAFGSLMTSALEGNFAEYRQRLQDQITSLARDGYKAAADTLKAQSSALTQASLDYSALTGKLKSASSAYDDLTAKMLDQYNTSRDMIAGLGKATDAQSFDQLTYLLGETTSKATEYQSVLASLKAQGLSENLWNQLAQAGPESMGLAQSILDQGTAGIAQLNSLSGGLLSAADSMGTLVRDSMYEQGADALQAYIDGMKSMSSALEAQMETIANNVLNKTAGAITPGNAGYSSVSAAPQQVVNKYEISVKAEDFGDLQTVQDLIDMLNQAPTTQLVNQAGTVTS